MLYIPPKRLWPNTRRAQCSAQPRNAERAHSLDVRYDISTILAPHSQRNAKLVALWRHYFVTKFKRVADRGRPQPYLCVLAHSKKARGLCAVHMVQELRAHFWSSIAPSSAANDTGDFSLPSSLRQTASLTVSLKDLGFGTRAFESGNAG
jgi:hypothetical protein